MKKIDKFFTEQWASTNAGIYTRGLCDKCLVEVFIRLLVGKASRRLSTASELVECRPHTPAQQYEVSIFVLEEKGERRCANIEERCFDSMPDALSYVVNLTRDDIRRLLGDMRIQDTNRDIFYTLMEEWGIVYRRGLIEIR